MLSLSASPQVSSTANVHEFCLIEGDVQVRSAASVAPGSAITAEKGASVCVDEAGRLLPGVVVEAIAVVSSPMASDVALVIPLAFH